MATQGILELIVRFRTAVGSVVRNERGASMVEYAFLVALIAIAAIVAVSFFGNNLRAEFSDIGTSVANS